MPGRGARRRSLLHAPARLELRRAPGSRRGASLARSRGRGSVLACKVDMSPVPRGPVGEGAGGAASRDVGASASCRGLLDLATPCRGAPPDGARATGAAAASRETRIAWARTSGRARMPCPAGGGNRHSPATPAAAASARLAGSAMARASASVSGLATILSPMPSCTSTGFGANPAARAGAGGRTRLRRRGRAGSGSQCRGVEQGGGIRVVRQATPGAVRAPVHADAGRIAAADPHRDAGLGREPSEERLRQRRGGAGELRQLAAGDVQDRGRDRGLAAVKTPPITPPSDWPR